VNNIDHIPLCEFDRGYPNSSIRIKVVENHYPIIVNIINSPTMNCQVMSAANIGFILGQMNKYQIRKFLMSFKHNIRISKKILLIDIKQEFVEHVENSLAKSSIINKMDYTSTNGSNMTIMLIKLSSIRQLKLPQI